MSTKDENQTPREHTEMSTLDKEYGNSIHVEVTSDLSEDDQAFLNSFTEEQRKKVLWKVRRQLTTRH